MAWHRYKKTKTNYIDNLDLALLIAVGVVGLAALIGLVELYLIL